MKVTKGWLALHPTPTLEALQVKFTEKLIEGKLPEGDKVVLEWIGQLLSERKQADAKRSGSSYL